MPELGVPVSAACIFYESLFTSGHAHRATHVPVGSFSARGFSTKYRSLQSYFRYIPLNSICN